MRKMASHMEMQLIYEISRRKQNKDIVTIIKEEF